MNRFSKAIKAFANINPQISELNPKELRNNSGRIIRKIDGKATEMIYLRTYTDSGQSPRALTADKPEDEPF